MNPNQNRSESKIDHIEGAALAQILPKGTEKLGEYIATVPFQNLCGSIVQRNAGGNDGKHRNAHHDPQQTENGHIGDACKEDGNLAAHREFHRESFLLMGF